MPLPADEGRARDHHGLVADIAGRGARIPRLVGGLAIAAAVTAILSVVGWPADRYRHNDFIGFWAGSRALLEGLDPYDVSTWLALHERVGSHGLAIVPPRTGFGYPLVTAIVFAPFALLPIMLAAPAWIVAQAGLALVATSALARSLLATTFRRDLPVLVALGATSQPAWVLAEGGNIGGFLLAATAAATWLLLRDRPFAAGAVAGVLIVKPHLFVFAVPIVLLSLPRRVAGRLAAGGALTAGTLVAASLVLRPGWLAEWLVPVARLQASPVGRATVFGLLPPDARALGWIAVPTIVVVAALWARGARSRALVAAAALPVSLFVAPYGWSYDQLVLVVTLGVILSYVAPASERVRVPFLALLALVVVALPWVLYVLAFSRGEEAWSAVVPLTYLATLALAVRSGRIAGLHLHRGEEQR